MSEEEIFLKIKSDPVFATRVLRAVLECANLKLDSFDPTKSHFSCVDRITGAVCSVTADESGTLHINIDPGSKPVGPLAVFSKHAVSQPSYNALLILSYALEMSHGLKGQA